MIVRQILVGHMQNFTYVVGDEPTRDAIIIDPSWDLDKVQNAVADEGLRPRYIVNTHYHFDHTLGNEALARSTGAKIIQHSSSELSRDISVDDGDAITFGDSRLSVLHTPGHSQDSICLVDDTRIFTGDTLFVGSCGRVDLPGGSAAQLYRSLFDVLSKMEGSLVVYPGHHYGATPTSTISAELSTNPVLQPRSLQEFLAMMGQP